MKSAPREFHILQKQFSQTPAEFSVCFNAKLAIFKASFPDFAFLSWITKKRPFWI